MERLRREEEVASASRQKEQLGQTVRGLEQELAEKLDEVQTLQVRGNKPYPHRYNMYLVHVRYYSHLITYK